MMHPATSSVRVWDAPVRVFHGLLALSVAGAWLTSESERWHLVHIPLGYTAGLLLAVHEHAVDHEHREDPHRH